ncbi:MAG: S8 family serine peptidase, partial [Microcoleaceae cyanobacterium]
MSTPPKISPAFEQFLAGADANTHKAAVVLFRGAQPPSVLPEKGTQAYFSAINSQAQSNQAVVAEMAVSYRSETGESLNAETIGSGALPAAKVEVTPETLSALASQPNVIAILPNQRIKLIKPQAIDYSDLNSQEEKAKLTWGLQTMEIPKVWETTKGKDITVAVLDTGVHDEHRALQGKVKGFVIIDPQGRRITATPAFDGGEHGTHVCGTIAGGTTETGVAIGVAPEAKLLAAGVLIGDSTVRTLIEGMSWAIEQGANIINMSLGLSYYEPLFAQVFDLL